MNKIYLIGDSTCQNNTRKTYPQHGWGQVFSAFISKDYQIINLAKNGSRDNRRGCNCNCGRW